MKFKIPFSILPPKVLVKASPVFIGLAELISPFFPFIQLNLKQAEIELEDREYLSMCLFSTILFFLFFGFIIYIFLLSFKINGVFLKAFLISTIFSFFVFIQQTMYPKLLANRRIKKLEKNLIAALQNMLVQLYSGVPLFDILVNIGDGDYGEVSKEISKVVSEINAGKPQIEALTEIAAINPSLFFRRSIWQIVNGMKAGSDLTAVIKEMIDSLSEEQVIQIQKYGGQLSPISMFYMLIAVIIPALGMTFLIIISSFINMSTFATKIAFWGMYGFVFFAQVMFMGVIRTRRPNLLGD
jgi:pilus assembly protein TadC